MHSAKGGKVRNPLLYKSARRVDFDHPLEYINNVYISPDGLGDLNEKREVDFVFSSGSSAFRFAETPIIMGYMLEQRVAKAGEVEAHWAKSDNQVLQGFLPEALGVSAWIHKVEIYINNVEIASCQSGFGNFYQALSARLAPQKVRKMLNAYHIPDSQEDITTGMNSELEDSLDCGNGMRWILGTYLGLPYLGPPKNLTLSQLIPQKGEKNVADLVPPGCDVRIRFTFHEDRMFRVGRTTLNATHFFTSGAKKTDWNATVNIDDAKFRIKLLRMVLAGEKLSFGFKSNLQSEVLGRDAMEFYYDKPGFSPIALNADLQATTHPHQIPPNTKMAYLCFPQSHQLYGDAIGSRKSECSLFALPDNMIKITILLNDEIILWPEGLKVKSGVDLKSLDRLKLYQSLKEQHLTDRPFVDYVSAGQTSYNNVFIIDLTKYQDSGWSILKVSMEFEEGLSRKGWYSMITFPMQASFKRHAGGLTWQKTS